MYWAFEKIEEEVCFSNIFLLLRLTGESIHLVLELLGEVEFGRLGAFKVKSAIDLISTVHYILTNLQRQRWVVVFDFYLTLELVYNSWVLEVGDSSLTASLDGLTFVDVAVLKTIVALQLLRGLWREYRLSKPYLLVVLRTTLISVDARGLFLGSVFVQVLSSSSHFLMHFV